MLQINNNSNEVKDNTITINGSSFMVTDAVAQQIYDLCCGKVKVNKVTNEPKQPYVATKDFKAQYKIVKNGNLYCIQRSNGWTRAEKNAMNSAIKALDGITEISVPFVAKNGKESAYKAWGYKKKSDAEKMMATLPAVFTAEELNK